MRIPTQVRQVREALKREFASHIDLRDCDRKSEGETEQILLSRALSALIVRHLTGCSSGEAAEAVTDGRDDHGIDAVSVIDPHLWLIQAKWSDSGRARVTQHDVRSIFSGIRLLDEEAISRFNNSFRRRTDSALTILRKPEGRVTVVIAAMRSEPLSVEVEGELRDEEARLNHLGDVFNHVLFDARDIWKIIQQDVIQPPIELVAKMKNWTRVEQPYDAFSGAVGVADVAQWYEDHGDLLFVKNIRMSLGLTQVNVGIRKTLLQNPHDFWYLNNGITVLCDSLQPVYWRRGGISPPVELRLQGASVVNGAQTVVATHDAMRQDPDTVSLGMVEVRAISLQGCPPHFASLITEATNTQNHVEARDFVALDTIQGQIRDDFRLSLQKEYVIRRGEPIPAPDTGCSVDDAAIALACGHARAEYAARARKPDLLWERGKTGTYDRLFSGPPSAVRIWRLVCLVRSVRSSLQSWRSTREGRITAIADHGEFLIAHLVVRQVGLNDIDDPDTPWPGEDYERVSETAIETTIRLSSHLKRVYGENAYIGSTFANPDRCLELARLVMIDYEAVVPVAESPETTAKLLQVPRRRRNAVPVLVDAQRLPDGTPLEYRPASKTERSALATWLLDDPARGRATWVNERRKPLLWAVDRQRYSPSGLVEHMWNLAEWKKRPVSVQGPNRWIVPGQGSLWDLALAVLDERESGG